MAMNRIKAPRDLGTIKHELPRTQRPSRDRSSRGGQREEKREEVFHALKMQKVLSTIEYRQRNAIKEEISEIDSFEQFDLLPLIKEAIGPQALEGQTNLVPTPVQRLAIPALIGQALGRRAAKNTRHRQAGIQQFLLAAETGSGKTLAYLLPIIDAVKRAEVVELEEEAKNRVLIEEKKRKDPSYIEPPPLDDRMHATSGRPRAIILLPTSELVQQVAHLIRLLAYKVKVRSKGISAADAPHTIRRRVFAEGGIDILVSTPHLISAVSASDPNILSRVRHLVIDEADSLMDRSFSKTVQPILDKSAPALQQLIFCSATIPRSLESHLREKYPDLRRIVTPSLHTIPRRIKLDVVDIDKFPYQGNRKLASADAIYNLNRVKHESAESLPEFYNMERILVFVNEREETTELADYLQSKGIDAVAFNRDASDERSSEVLKDFVARPPHLGADPNELEALPSTAASNGDRTASSAFSSTNKSPSQDPPALPKPNFLAARSHSSGASTNNPAPPKPPPTTQRRLEKVKVIVSTDLLSRGVDTLGVRHVLLYDVPHTVTDFIHRLGRVGRMKMRGRGIVLVGRNDRKDVVKEVREAMFKGQALI